MAGKKEVVEGEGAKEIKVRNLLGKFKFGIEECEKERIWEGILNCHFIFLLWNHT